MKKNIVIIFVVVLFISACGINTKTEYKTDAARSVQTDTDEMYKLLNQNLLGKDFLKYIGEDLIVRGVCDYSEEVKGEFVPIINEESNFPEELVVMLEEAFYHSGNVKRDNISYNISLPVRRAIFLQVLKKPYFVGFPAHFPFLSFGFKARIFAETFPS